MREQQKRAWQYQIPTFETNRKHQGHISVNTIFSIKENLGK